MVIKLVLVTTTRFISLDRRSFTRRVLLPTLLTLKINVVKDQFLLFCVGLTGRYRHNADVDSFFLT